MKIALFLLICNLTFANDLKIEIKTLKKEFIYVEKIVVKYKIKNNTNYYYIHPDEKIYMRYEDGTEYLLTYIAEPSTIEIEWPLLKPSEEISGYNVIYARPKAGKCWIYYKMPGGFKTKSDPNYGFFKDYNLQNSRVLRDDIKSNEEEIEVKEPEGIDKEVYEKYLRDYDTRMKATDSTNDLFWKLLEKYPSSRYSEWLAVKEFINCGLKKNCRISNKEESYKLCKSLMKRESTYYTVEPIAKVDKETKNRYERKIKILEEIIKEHSDCKNYLLYILSYEILHYGDYKKAKYYFNQVLNFNPEIDQNKELMEEAKEIIKCINEEEK